MYYIISIKSYLSNLQYFNTVPRAKLNVQVSFHQILINYMINYV